MHRQFRRITTSILILINVLHIDALVLPISEGAFDRTPADFVSVRRHDGERTIVVRLGGVSAIEMATGELPRTIDGSSGTEPSFIFREATDGRELVQAIYDGNHAPKNCYISTDQETMLGLLERMRQASLMFDGTSPDSSQVHYGTKNSKHPALNIVNTPMALLPYLPYAHNASDHTLAFIQTTATSTGNDGLPSLLRSVLSLDLIKSQCGRLLNINENPTGASPPTWKGRPRRGLLTYPKTLWCGKGTEATHYDELGEDASTDRCCRAHDHCPHLQIKPLERKMFLRNIAPYVISDCKCDKLFHKCLKKTGSPVAMGVGDVYFNRLKIKCFVTRKKYQCLESSWLGSCLRREKSDTAVVRDARPFPEGKNLTKAEKCLRRKSRRELLVELS